jgi:hypothetical protein
MRLHSVESRVANLERLLGRKVSENSTDFERQVTVWLIRNDEYRLLAQQIFERCYESEEAVTSQSFDSVVSPEERERLHRLIQEGEAAVRADLSSGNQKCKR